MSCPLLQGPWLFTQLRLMASRSHLNHYESPHYLGVKSFIPKNEKFITSEMEGNLTKHDAKVEENFLLLL